jgi:hypothetical protein
VPDTLHQLQYTAADDVDVNHALTSPNQRRRRVAGGGGGGGGGGSGVGSGVVVGGGGGEGVSALGGGGQATAREVVRQEMAKNAMTIASLHELTSEMKEIFQNEVAGHHGGGGGGGGDGGKSASSGAHVHDDGVVGVFGEGGQHGRRKHTHCKCRHKTATLRPGQLGDILDVGAGGGMIYAAPLQLHRYMRSTEGANMLGTVREQVNLGRHRVTADERRRQRHAAEFRAMFATELDGTHDAALVGDWDRHDAAAAAAADAAADEKSAGYYAASLQTSAYMMADAARAKTFVAAQAAKMATAATAAL